MDHQLNDLKLAFLTGYPKVKLLQTIHDQGVDITVLVLPNTEKYLRNCDELINLASRLNIPILQTHPKILSEELLPYTFNTLISCGYPYIIPTAVYNRARYAINFHPTLLPKHRGRFVHHVLFNKELESGVTAHMISERLDAGPILDQEKFCVTPFDTVKSLLRKCSEVEIPLMERVLNALRKGKLHPLPQNESEACEHFEKKTPADSEVDPNIPLKDLFYTLRTFDPDLYPGFFYVDGQKVFIKIYRQDKPESESDMI
jgi:methionyl-tRNA formyltransferase